MSTRRATATQAEIARAIRALEAAGHKHPRIIYTAEGVIIEPGPPPRHQPDTPVEDEEPERIIIM
ncbi:hypothetical protein [Methylobacterium sp. Leaf361]|uniref:hypothetical protein n=1 Tax=Methylobacterium sp. Leaf361 TaxID=1736352 RepID=UPI000AA267AC|nr:hypothetical protein [Methylobacterium sp. Leaf361]